MSKLPQISARECVVALQKGGFYFLRQTGSHIHLRRDEPFAQVSVPNHKEIKIGTLRSIIRGAGLTIEEFLKLL
jgi:predicted RNA binding protein YcfA (HicA-like mRNA interferase family)